MSAMSLCNMIFSSTIQIWKLSSLVDPFPVPAFCEVLRRGPGDCWRLPRQSLHKVKTARLKKCTQMERTWEKGNEVQSDNETPCVQQIAWPSTLKSSSCSLALTAQKILRQTSWNSVGGFRVFSPLSNIFSPSIGFAGQKLVSLARNRTEGEPIPYCSKLPAQNTFKIGVL